MSLLLSDEQQMLRDAARKYFAEKSPVSRMRQLRDERDPLGYSPQVWRDMAELGWLGILLAEAHGGSAMGLRELGVVMMEAGRVLAPEPMLSTLLLGGNAVRLSECSWAQSDILPAVASGEHKLAMAFEETGRFDPYYVTTQVALSDGGYSLIGEKTYVIDGHVADYFVVLARMNGEAGDRNGLGLFLVDADADGIAAQRTTMMDGRGAARINLSGVNVAADRMLGDADLLDRVIDQATMGLVAEMVGMADEVFERTVAYLKEREQFGVKIGTFQALRHRAAEMFGELEFARTLLIDGLCAIDEGREDAALSVSAAKAQACKTVRLIGAEGVQMHGGMGMTDELDIGLFFKRMKAAELTLGDETYHHRRYASLRGY